jgi:hypothetical protein
MLQMDVFNTFIELLRQTGNVTKGQNDRNDLRQVNSYVLLLPKSHFFFVLTTLVCLWTGASWNSYKVITNILLITGALKTWR